jgi:hypothetical protein
VGRGYPQDGITTAGQGTRCLVRQPRGGGTKERETGGELEGVRGSAHQAFDRDAGLQVLRYRGGDFFVTGTQDGIAEVFAGFVEVLNAVILRGSRTSESSELWENIPDPMLAFSAGAASRPARLRSQKCASACAR